MGFSFEISVQPFHLFYKIAYEFGLYETSLCKGQKEINEMQLNGKEVINYRYELLNNFTFFPN